MITFADFYKKHENSNIIVCGCGVSLPQLKDHYLDFITIGVNDVDRCFPPTYLLLSDDSSRFNESRRLSIFNTKAKYVFTNITSWRFEDMSKKIIYKLGKMGTSHVHDNSDKLDYYLHSPYIACCLAYKMGAKNIGMIGVDFVPDHFYAKDGDHPVIRAKQLERVDQSYSVLASEFKKNNVTLYNLSDISKITTLPKITISQFKQL